MDLAIVIIWVIALSSLGESGVVLNFIPNCSVKNPFSKRNSSTRDGPPRSTSSQMGTINRI